MSPSHRRPHTQSDSRWVEQDISSEMALPEKPQQEQDNDLVVLHGLETTNNHSLEVEWSENHRLRDSSPHHRLMVS